MRNEVIYQQLIIYINHSLCNDLLCIPFHAVASTGAGAAGAAPGVWFFAK